MSECQTVDGLVTPYVDGELNETDRGRVEGHLRACPPCRVRVESEQAVRSLMRDRQAALAIEAPPWLRTRIAETTRASAAQAASRWSWRAALVPLALAA